MKMNRHTEPSALARTWEMQATVEHAARSKTISFLCQSTGLFLRVGPTAPTAAATPEHSDKISTEHSDIIREGGGEIFALLPSLIVSQTLTSGES